MPPAALPGAKLLKKFNQNFYLILLFQMIHRYFIIMNQQDAIKFQSKNINFRAKLKRFQSCN